MAWDLTNVEAAGSYEPLPAGNYLVVGRAGELKTTKSGTGKYVKVELEVIEGAFKGRKLWAQFNVANENQQAVNIGLAQMKQFFLAAGCKPEHIKSLTEESFAGKVVTAIVTQETDAYGTKNVIKGYKSETGEAVKSQAKAGTTGTATSVTKAAF